MNKNRRKFLIGIPLVLIIPLSIIAAFLWFQPLFGAGLNGNSANFNPNALEKQPIAPKPTESSDVSENEGTTLTNKIPQKPGDVIKKPPAEPLCNGPTRMSVLVLGIDERAQSDAIRMVSIDFLTGQIAILSIPRDFYVSIVGMESHNIFQGRINATYGYGEKFLGRGNGVFTLAENLTYNFNVTFDHYLVLHLDNIAQYIDEVGGVDLLLERPVSDGYSHFPSGLNHLDGETAVIFMRMRLYDDDHYRVRRQTQVLRAFYTKVMSELSIVEQTQFALRALADKNIQTDFALKDISSLVCLARQIEEQDVRFIEIPKDMYRSATTSSGAAVLIPNDAVVPFIQNAMGNSQ
jgi:LCP family protein required for cell wall assembly